MPEPNINAYTVILFAHAVLLALSQLDFVTQDLSRVLVIGVIVVDAALAIFFRTSPGKTTIKRVLTK